MQAAAVRADRIGDAAGAMGLLSGVLAMQGVPDADVLAAARKVEPLLETAGIDEERLGVLERIAVAERDADARREALGTAAQLAARLRQNERAIGVCRSSAWRRTRGTPRRSTGSWGSSKRRQQAELARYSGSQRTRRRTRNASVADRVRVAKLLGDALGRQEDAIAAWREVEREFGEADDAALALASLLRDGEHWKELADLLERGAKRTTDDATRAELLRQLGDVYREQLGAPEDAVATYALALEADARNAGARAGLQVLAGEDAHRARAVEVLLSALRRCDDAGDPRADGPQVARRAHGRGQARRAPGTSESPRTAPATWGSRSRRCAGVRPDPGDARVATEIERLAGAGGAWEALVATYREAMEGAARGDAALVTRLRAKVGEALETRLDDLRGALASYLLVVREASELEGGVAAVRVAGRLGEWVVAATVVVDFARAWGAAGPELLAAYEVAAGAADAWEAAAEALADAVSAGSVDGTAARDLEARIAEWHRDRR